MLTHTRGRRTRPHAEVNGSVGEAACPRLGGARRGAGFRTAPGHVLPSGTVVLVGGGDIPRYRLRAKRPRSATLGSETGGARGRCHGFTWLCREITGGVFTATSSLGLGALTLCAPGDTVRQRWRHEERSGTLGATCYRRGTRRGPLRAPPLFLRGPGAPPGAWEGARAALTCRASVPLHLSFPACRVGTRMGPASGGHVTWHTGRAWPSGRFGIKDESHFSVSNAD